jgi:hypothetical protein
MTLVTVSRVVTLKNRKSGKKWSCRDKMTLNLGLAAAADFSYECGVLLKSIGIYRSCGD